MTSCDCSQTFLVTCCVWIIILLVWTIFMRFYLIDRHQLRRIRRIGVADASQSQISGSNRADQLHQTGSSNITIIRTQTNQSCDDELGSNSDLLPSTDSMLKSRSHSTIARISNSYVAKNNSKNMKITESGTSPIADQHGRVSLSSNLLQLVPVQTAGTINTTRAQNLNTQFHSGGDESKNVSNRNNNNHDSNNNLDNHTNHNSHNHSNHNMHNIIGGKSHWEPADSQWNAASAMHSAHDQDLTNNGDDANTAHNVRMNSQRQRSQQYARDDLSTIKENSNNLNKQEKNGDETDTNIKIDPSHSGIVLISIGKKQKNYMYNYPFEKNYDRYVKSTKNKLDVSKSGAIKSKNKSNIDRWLIDDMVIGKGAFSHVCKGIDKQQSSVVAIKFMFRSSRQGKWLEWAASNEITCLTKISHNNVIKLLAYDMNGKYKNEDVILFVLEYAARGELTELLYRLGKFDEILARTYFRQIISGIEACHKVGIVHRDIKVQNILLDWSYNIKICDFGLSKLTTNKDLSIKSHLVGTPGFTAPEVSKKQDYNSLCDIFSAGVVLFVMLTGRRPFGKVVVENEQEKLIYHPKYQLFIDDSGKYWKSYADHGINLSKSVQELLERVLRDDPSARLKIEDILLNKWFGGHYIQPDDISNQITLRTQFINFHQSKTNEDNVDIKAILNKAASDNGPINNTMYTTYVDKHTKHIHEQGEFEQKMPQKAAKMTRRSSANVYNMNRNHGNAYQFNYKQEQEHSQVAIGSVFTRTNKRSTPQPHTRTKPKHRHTPTHSTFLSQLSMISNSETDLTYYIRDPLVTVMCIGDYDTNVMPSLIGASQDYLNCIYTFHRILGYSVVYQNKITNEIEYARQEMTGQVQDVDESKQQQPKKNKFSFKSRWTCAEIEQFFNNVQNKAVTNNHDACIFIVSAHGERESVILDSTGDKVSLGLLFGNFNGKYCPEFAARPKIIFVDACRGSMRAKPIQSIKAQTVSVPPIITDDQHNVTQARTHNTDQIEKESKSPAMINVNDVNDKNRQIIKNMILINGKYYHEQSNFRYIYGNPDGFAVPDGGDKGGYLIRGTKRVFSNPKIPLKKNLDEIVNKIRTEVYEMVDKGAQMAVEDVNTMTYNIKFVNKSVK